MSEPVLLRDDRDGVRTLTLNRPQQRNALNGELWAALCDALAGIDRDVRAVVITGAGGAFCSGADITDADPTVHPMAKLRVLTDAALLLHELPVPTVAEVTGVAVGAGWNLALGCDLVVATPEARFSQIFARRGLSLDFGGSWLLPRLVGLQQAKRLALLAEMIDADEAHALGLVTWVVPADEVDAFVVDLTDRLAVGSVAQAHAAVATTIDYVKERTAFGTPVASFQNTKFELAAMTAEIEAAQAMLDRAVLELVAGQLSGADAAKVKLLCTETQGRVVDRCLQLFGGYGYLTEYPIARLYTDARITRIYAGTSEVMKVIIAKSLGL